MIPAVAGTRGAQHGTEYPLNHIKGPNMIQGISLSYIGLCGQLGQREWAALEQLPFGSGGVRGWDLESSVKGWMPDRVPSMKFGISEHTPLDVDELSSKFLISLNTSYNSPLYNALYDPC